MLCSAAVCGRRWSLPASARVSKAIWRSCVFQRLDCYTVSFTTTELCREFSSAQRKRDYERSMPGLTVSAHAWCNCSGERFVVYNTEKRSQMCEIHLYEAALRGPAGGECVFFLPWLKSCQAVCDECTRGEIYSSLSRDAGCLAMWSWRESCVTKIWGSGHDHGFVLFLFATTGFHIARSGIFWTPTFVL